jgi:hypothetical protein
MAPGALKRFVPVPRLLEVAAMIEPLAMSAIGAGYTLTFDCKDTLLSL